jgi:hypothetical protein
VTETLLKNNFFSCFQWPDSIKILSCLFNNSGICKTPAFHPIVNKRVKTFILGKGEMMGWGGGELESNTAEIFLMEQFRMSGT